jgi:hypothetical protein
MDVGNTIQTLLQKLLEMLILGGLKPKSQNFKIVVMKTEM